MTAAMVGWAHMPFGKHSEETVESMIVKVAVDAIKDAGIEPGDVDEILLGHFNAGFSAQDFTASLVLQGPIRPCASNRQPVSKTPAPPALPPCIRACVPLHRAMPASCLLSASNR